jgi:hypothetical protein
MGSIPEQAAGLPTRRSAHKHLTSRTSVISWAGKFYRGPKLRFRISSGRISSEWPGKERAFGSIPTTNAGCPTSRSFFARCGIPPRSPRSSHNKADLFLRSSGGCGQDPFAKRNAGLLRTSSLLSEARVGGGDRVQKHAAAREFAQKGGIMASSQFDNSASPATGDTHIVRWCCQWPRWSVAVAPG